MDRRLVAITARRGRRGRTSVGTPKERPCRRPAAWQKLPKGLEAKGGDGNFFRHVASRDLRSDPGHALTALWCSVATAVWTATSAHTVAVSQ